MIVWARLPVFSIGVMAWAEPDTGRQPGRAGLIAAACTVLLLGWLTSLSSLSDSFTIRAVYKLLLFAPMTLALMALLSRFGRKVRILEWVGGLSLELYLVHITLLHPLKYYGILSALGNWLYLFLPLVSLLLAWLVGILEKRILRLAAKS